MILGLSIQVYDGFSRFSILFFKGLLQPENVGEIATFIIRLIMVAVIMLSAFSIYKARITDRRWRALYNFGITIVVLCAFVFSAFYDMDLSDKQNIWCQVISFFAIGCVITGGSLY